MPGFFCLYITINNRILWSLKLKAVLKVHVDFEYFVDWSGRHEDSCGNSETDETPQTRSGEEARRSP